MSRSELFWFVVTRFSGSLRRKSAEAGHYKQRHSMSSAGGPPFETILKLCQQAGREPWYPGEFAAALGIDPRKLKGPLDELRLAGLIDETEWQPGREHGYRLTRAGEKVLQTPRLMAQIRAGELPHYDREEAPGDAELPAEAAVARSSAVMKWLLNNN